jgi:hypothetical protein
MSGDLEEALRWLAQNEIYKNDKFHLFFMSEENGTNPTVIVVDNSIKIAGRSCASTYSEAFIDAINQARKKIN